MKKHVLLNKAGWMLGLFVLFFIMMYSCKEDTVKPTDDSPDIKDANHEDAMLHEFVFNTTKKSGTNERFAPEYNDLTADQTIRFVEAAVNFEFGNPQLEFENIEKKQECFTVPVEKRGREHFVKKEEVRVFHEKLKYYSETKINELEQIANEPRKILFLDLEKDKDYAIAREMKVCVWVVTVLLPPDNWPFPSNCKYSENDWWYIGSFPSSPGSGYTGGCGQNNRTNSSADIVMESRLNRICKNKLPHGVVESPYPFFYYYDITTFKDLTPYDFPVNDDPNYHTLLYLKQCLETESNCEPCLNPDEMTFYTTGAFKVANMVKPSSTITIAFDLKSDAVFADTYTDWVHKLDLTVGKTARLQFK